MPLLPGAEPFAHDDGPVGALLLHGFGGSPAQLRPLALRLADEGLSVLLPRLPGHGTSWQDLAVCRWDDFHAEADRALTLLLETCRDVVVVGHGVGGALALRLAELRPDDVSGLVLLNPALELRRPSRAAALLLPVASVAADDEVRRGGGYDRIPLRALRSVAHDGFDPVRDGIAAVTAPVLLVRSAQDRVVAPASTEWLLEHLPGPDVTDLALDTAGHHPQLDDDAARVESACVDFVHRVAPSSADA